MGTRSFLLTAFATLLLFTAVAFAQSGGDDDLQTLLQNPNGPDPGIPDTVKVESTTIGDLDTSFVIEVYLYNDEDLGGFNLPIAWDSPYITCDSVTFDGTRIEYVNTKLYSVDNDNNRLQAGMIIFFEQYLQPGYGSIYNVHFTRHDMTPHVITFDSVFYPPGGTFALTGTNGLNFLPQFVQGTVVVGTPPTPEISVSPPQFNITGAAGGPNPPNEELTITNSGTGTLNWTVSNSSGWLYMIPLSGTGNGAITVDIDLTGLTAGIYHDTIVVEDPAAVNSPKKVPVTLTVEGNPPEISLDPTSISLTVTEGDVIGDDQITITNTGGGTLNWSASNLTGWITLTPTNGVGNGMVTLQFDITGVGPGTYYDTITVSDPAASNDPQKVPVALTIEPPPPTIALAPTSISLVAMEGDAIPDEQIAITNTGGSTLNWSATKLTGWLTLIPTSGTGDGVVTLQFDITGLTAGIYYDTVVISDPAATNNPQAVPVALTIEPPPPAIALDPTLIEITAMEGSAIPDEHITVTNTGGGVLDWTATNATGWISLDPASGEGNGIIALAFDITGVPAGVYYDTVSVSDPAASNSPQKTAVILTIETEAAPVIDVSPTSLTFTATSGGGNPPDKILNIANTGGGSLNWTIDESITWLTVNPMAGEGDGSVTVSVDVTGLAQGTYDDIILVIDPAADNSPVEVPVTLIISDFAYGTAIIEPNLQHVIRANAVDPAMNTIHIGEFGVYTVNDIDQATVVVNDNLIPELITILPSYPDFTGEVMEIVVAARPFILGYGLVYDTTRTTFTVSGLMTDQTILSAEGDITFIGHRSGDVNSDGRIDVGDVICIIRYFMKGEKYRAPLLVGDVNCDQTVDVGDAVHLLNYIFKRGPGLGCGQ